MTTWTSPLGPGLRGPRPETLPSHSIIKDLKLCSTTPSFMSANNAIFSETSEVPESFRPLVDPNFCVHQELRVQELLLAFTSASTYKQVGGMLGQIC